MFFMRHHEGNYNGCFFERQHGACCNVHYLPGAGHTATHPTPNPSLLLEKTSGLAAGSVFTGRRAGWLWVTKFPDKPGRENGHLLVLREMEYSTVGTITRSFTNHLDRVHRRLCQLQVSHLEQRASIPAVGWRVCIIPEF